MTVHPVTTTTHAVDTVTGTAPGPRTVPLWRIVVRTVMGLGVVHPAPAVSVSSKGINMVGQGLW